ncbi:MAG: response regulator [Dehalococcoidia bacterium]
MVAARPRSVIAVINSSPDVVDMLELALQDEGYHTVGATLGELLQSEQSLLTFLDEHDPHLIIYDVSPPYPRNWDRFQVVREVETFRNRRVMLTTTDKNALDRLIGPTDSYEVFSKPFELDILLSAVRQAVSSEDAG